MTTIDAAKPDEKGASTGEGAWKRIESILERGSEWLNPILVKEARQALKSKQFAITFTLLLIFAWGWSLLGVAWFMRDSAYMPRGPEMLIGYFLILAFPLSVIVPFSAFRSLAAEREDGTYELLSITSLKARQVIGGKLGSAILQMMVYFSALAPCVAFTYLLRGVDVVLILLLLTYTFLASVLLAMFGLMLATVSRAVHWNVVLSVVLIVFLLLCMWGGSMWVCSGVIPGYIFLPMDEPHFWIAQLVVLSAWASYMLLFYLAAAARISFASENRSTRLRWVMLLQQMLLIGWAAFYAIELQEEDVMLGMFSLAMVHWGVMGALMCGETAQMSQRIKRKLPQSLFGRLFLSWFNPGPGTGYMFAVTNMLTIIACYLTLGLIGQTASQLAGKSLPEIVPQLWPALRDGAGNLMRSEITWFGILTLCYVIIYVGMGRTIVLGMSQLLRCGPFLSLLVLVILVLLGVIIPLILQGFFIGFDYTLLQAPNLFWTLGEASYDGGGAYDSVIGVRWLGDVPIMLMLVAAIVLVVNLVLAATEVRHERQVAPSRVTEDEAAQHPQLAADQPPRSPFDD